MPPKLGGMIDQNQTCPLWIPECSDGGGTPELEGNSGANRGEAQLRANFEACKLQANSALQRCTVTPRPSNCALATDFEARFLRLASPCRRLARLTIPTRFLEQKRTQKHRRLFTPRNNLAILS